ncbi:MAG TPA: MFS transporter [Bacteroidetes bacterium]|nr:MFS transporter [Bacteroidota bacterium]HIL56623.1 MFS transporter [Rhodothermales bacterium]
MTASARPAPFPRPFWVLFAGTLVNRLGLVVLPFLTLYLTGVKGYSVEAATLVVSLHGAGGFAAGFAGGALADRLGRKAVLVGSLLGGAVLFAVLPEAEAFVALAGLMVGAGLVGESYRPAVSAAVSDLVEPARQARAFALMYWAINVGAAVGPAVGGLLAERVGYRALFWVDAVTMATFALVVALGVPETRPDEPAGRPRPRGRLRLALRDPALVGLACASLAVGTVFMQAFSTLPLVMRADGLGEAAFGLAVTVNGGIVVALSLPVARWAETRIGPGLLAGAAAVIGLGVGGHVFADTLGGHLLAAAVWSVGEVAFLPFVPVAVARLAPDELRATYQGVSQAGWGLAHMLGPALGGLTLARVGEGALWGGGAALAGLSALGILAFRLGADRR